MKNTNNLVQMIVKSSDFIRPVTLDKRYNYIVLDNLQYEQDIKELVLDLRKTLTNWKEAPVYNDVKKRFDAGSKVFLQYFEGKICGWFWWSEAYTRDWITKVKDLPSPNSFYGGGSYLNKSIAPANGGYQLYSYYIETLLKRYDTMYCYMEDWNKAPIRLVSQCGGIFQNWI